MESPPTMRRVTRSQCSALSQKTKKEDAASRSRNKGSHERGALLDITNDSPINGLAIKKTPLSLARKHRSGPNKTPGSGEALLRGQVKILLEKVEEEAELVNKLSKRPFPTFVPAMGLLPISPGLLMAPTPANTPLFFSHSGAKEEIAEVTDSVVVMEDVLNVLPKVAETLKHEKIAEPQVCALNRALQFDSPGKSDASDGSSVTYQGSIISCGKVCSTDEDNSSNWSIQANASAYTNDEEDMEEIEEEDNDDYSQDGADYDDVEEEAAAEECALLEVLCEGLRKFTVEDMELKLPEFTGKHIRFIYNSDDEIEGEDVCGAERGLSPSVIVLKGLPIPEGKHLRFHDEDEE